MLEPWKFFRVTLGVSALKGAMEVALVGSSKPGSLFQTRHLQRMSQEAHIIQQSRRGQWLLMSKEISLTWLPQSRTLYKMAPLGLSKF